MSHLQNCGQSIDRLTQWAPAEPSKTISQDRRRDPIPTNNIKDKQQMCGGIVYFVSRRKEYGLLSNFAAAEVYEKYPSSEHAMCALRGPPEFRHLLEIGGPLDGDQKRFEAFV